MGASTPDIYIYMFWLQLVPALRKRGGGGEMGCLGHNDSACCDVVMDPYS